MKKDRDLPTVLRQLRGMMPARYHADIDQLLERLRYKAPEQHHDVWSEAQYWLFASLGVDAPPLKIRSDELWRADVLALWADKSIEQMTAWGLFEFEEIA